MCHILIIEDDAVAAYDIRDTLKSVGGTSFSIAETQDEAVRCARETRPALITSDVMLASGSGPAAVRIIESELGPLPVIFITATPDQCERRTGHAVLEKPFLDADLTAAFRSAGSL